MMSCNGTEFSESGLRVYLLCTSVIYNVGPRLFGLYLNLFFPSYGTLSGRCPFQRQQPFTILLLRAPIGRNET